MADSALVTYSYYSPTRGGSQDPNIGVIHSIESPLRPGYAKTLVGPAYFGSSAAGVSIHYLVDPVDTCQGLPETTVGFHVGGGNRGTIGIEQAGYARFSSAEWNTADGQRQMARLSALMADISRRRPKIALRWLSDAQLRGAWGNPGVTGGWVTHDQMRRVIGGTTHYDPWNAPNANTAWPSGSVMANAVAISGGGQPVVPTTPSGEDDWLDMGAKEEILDALKNRKEGSQSVFDELSYAVNKVLIPAINNVSQQVAGLRSVLFQPGYDTAGHSIREEVQWAAAHAQQGVRLGVVIDDSTGAWYAVGPGVFWHLPNMNFVNTARAAGLIDEDEHHTDATGIAAVRLMALSENADILIAPKTYTVVAGDGFNSIATKLGVTPDALASANPQVTNRDSISVGDVLNIPKA